jgi:hypothetical protein
MPGREQRPSFTAAAERSALPGSSPLHALAAHMQARTQCHVLILGRTAHEVAVPALNGSRLDQRKVVCEQ